MINDWGEDRLTNAERDGERGCGGTREMRMSDIVKVRWFLFHLPLLKCKCLSTHRTLSPAASDAAAFVVPMSFRSCRLFNTLRSVIMQPAEEQTNCQTGRKHGGELWNAAQQWRNRARSETLTGKSGHFKWSERGHWKEDSHCTFICRTDSMHRYKLYYLDYTNSSSDWFLYQLKGKSPTSFTWSSSERVRATLGIPQ